MSELGLEFVDLVHPLLELGVCRVLADAAHGPTQNLGAAVAKSLFPVVGVDGMAALRIVLSALLLLAFWQPWRAPLGRRDRR